MSTDRIHLLEHMLEERVVLLDGAMGTMMQAHNFSEAAFRGERFADWTHPLKGNNDVLSITQPEAVRDAHLAYFRAGSDIVETNTFGSTTVAQADYGLEDHVREMNIASAKRAREAVEIAEKEDGRPRFVAGALGPTNRTASISPNVNDPGFRAISFDQLRTAYAEQVDALVEGGVDFILIETVFDTLNAKAAAFAVDDIAEKRGIEIRVIVSGTISDMSGRVLSGQTPEAFWTSLKHVRPLAFGLNCGLGAKEMRPYVEELADLIDVPLCVYPNAGLPNAFGQYDQTPDETGELLGAFARAGQANILGGCCGTTPDHIREIAKAVHGQAPRRFPHALHHQHTAAQ